MNDRTIWIFRIIAVFILLLFAYLMLSLHAKLRRMQEGEQARIEVQIADCRLPLSPALSPQAGRGSMGSAVPLLRPE